MVSPPRHRTRRSVACLAALVLSPAACTGSAPTAGPPEFPLVACPVSGASAPSAPPGFALVVPGTIAFGFDTWHNVSGANTGCGAQAVRGATSVIAFSALDGEDRISWAATLARPGSPTTPDPDLPTMTLYRLDPGSPIAVLTVKQEPFDEYAMRGSYGHDAQPGSYLMRIVSGSGDLLAEGRFEIVK